jgi:hypothetical protein
VSERRRVTVFSRGSRRAHSLLQSAQFSQVGVIPDSTDGTRIPGRSEPYGGLFPLSRARNPDGRTATPGPLSGGTDYTLNLTGISSYDAVNSYSRHSVGEEVGVLLCDDRAFTLQ